MDKKNCNRIVIIGAGQAGAQFALSLRQENFNGQILLIGEEKYLPYERPQLSKEVLLNTSNEIKLIKSAEEYKALNIEVMLDTKVNKVNAEQQCIEFNDGQRISYDILVIATGVSARQISSQQPNHFLSVRNIQDALDIKARLIAENEILIVGGGVIGLEVASAAIEKGCKVTVLETTSQLMGRSLDKDISEQIRAFHEERGVKFIFDISIDRIDEEQLIFLSNGLKLKPDLVILGIGVIPNNECVHHLSIHHDFGILVNENAQTQICNIYAIGDIAVQPNELGQVSRIETWQNAQYQAMNLAKYLVKNEQNLSQPNWFWSDQASLNLQVIGQVKDLKKIERKVDDKKSSFFYFNDQNELKGCLTLNNPKDMAVARRWVSTQQKIDLVKLADQKTSLKDCLLG